MCKITKSRVIGFHKFGKGSIFTFVFSKKLHRFYDYWQWLSLDVVLGACAGMLFFQKLLGVTLFPIAYALLAIAVWGIYTFDHLVDAQTIKGKASSPRHYFHQVHFRKLASVLALVTLAAVYLLFNYVRFPSLITWGTLLGMLILINIVFLKFLGKKLAFLKELSTAILYTAGISLGPVVRYGEEVLPKEFWLFALAYVLMAWFNLLLLSYLDKHRDFRDQMNSIIHVLGAEKVRQLLTGLTILGLLFTLSLFVLLGSYHYVLIILVLIMFLVHAIAFLQVDVKKEAARRQVDAIYMLPFLLLLL